MSQGSHRLYSRPAVLVLVSMLHVVLAVALLHAMQRTRRETGLSQQPVTARIVAERRRELPAPVVVDPSVPIQAITLDPPNLNIPDDLPARAPTAPLVDWHAEAKRQVEVIVRKEAQRPRAPDEAPALFESKKSAPLTTRDSSGRLVHWLNDDCYMTNLEHEPANRTDAIRVQNVNCKQDRIEPRGDLFDHLKRQDP